MLSAGVQNFLFAANRHYARGRRRQQASNRGSRATAFAGLGMWGQV